MIIIDNTINNCDEIANSKNKEIRISQSGKRRQVEKFLSQSEIISAKMQIAMPEKNTKLLYLSMIIFTLDR